jgi:ion channel POLLUX/CASTOR
MGSVDVDVVNKSLKCNFTFSINVIERKIMAYPEFRARLRYEFDKTMAAGPIALIGWLGLVSIAIILAAGALVAMFSIAPEGMDNMSFIEACWASLMRTLDSGTMGGDQGWSFRLVMLLVTLAGIFVVSALIGVMSSGLDNKLNELSKGRSKVLEKDHTIIFNWSASIFDVISELVIANESRRKPRIVIMADMEKVEMEDQIAEKIADLKNTRIICRGGDPTDLTDIGIVNPDNSRSIIIMSPESDDADSQVIKTILALVNGPFRRKERYQIAAELHHAESAELARVIGGAEVQIVLADDLIARVMVQSTRQPGLSAVFTELLDFDGCEIYVTEQPELTGQTFADAVLAYDTSSVIGVSEAEGVVSLNPPDSLVITSEMRIILIAEDDSTILLDGKASKSEVAVTDYPVAEPLVAERTLMLGWNRRATMVAKELSRYVGPGSLLTIAADVPEIEQAVAGISLANNNMSIELCKIDTGRQADISSLNPLSYDHVLVLAYSDHMSAQAADTRTLVSLLHLRRMKEEAGCDISIVSEMADVRNRELARVTNVDDFVVSNKLVSLMLSQASENEHLESIFKDLLDDDGSEICMRPAQNYLPLGQAATFRDVSRIALSRGELAIGHHLKDSGDSDHNVTTGGIFINPTKSAAVRYQDGDRIVVLALQQ